MRALWIAAAMLACAGAASAGGVAHGGFASRGHGGARGAAIGRSDFREDGSGRFAGALNGGWGFANGRYGDQGRYVHVSRAAYGRYGRSPAYGLAGGDVYGYGEAFDPGPFSLAPGELGPQLPYAGYGDARFGGSPGYGSAGWIGLYKRSGEGAYAYGYNGYAETPMLPFTTGEANSGYAAYGTAYIDQPPAPACGC